MYVLCLNIYYLEATIYHNYSAIISSLTSLLLKMETILKIHKKMYRLIPMHSHLKSLYQ